MSDDSAPIRPKVERCIHGLIKISCATCLPQVRPVRVPSKQDAPARLSLYDKPHDGLLIVRTSKGRRACGIERADKTVTFAHIDGVPFLWALRELLIRAPNLKTIQVIPSHYESMSSTGKDECGKCGVQVVSGHYKPELAWQGTDRIVNPQYESQRRFMLNMSGNQKRLFDELLALGFEPAHIAARYFCLNGQEYAPQRILKTEYGYARSCHHTISSIILSVLSYLDDTITVGEHATRRAHAMKARVERLRPYIESAEIRMRLHAELGIPSLASNFPLARIEELRALLAAMNAGRIASLPERQAYVIRRRFGLDEHAGVYRTLEEIGQALGVTRERVRQLEEKALDALGIAHE